MNVFRIQPIGSDLHGIETTTSNFEKAGGVHVFTSLPEVYACRDWCLQENIELATIECDESDVFENDDFEGSTLRSGRGRVIAKKEFRDTDALADWVDSVQ